MKDQVNWLKRYDFASKCEGWALFDADGVTKIWALDDIHIFEDQGIVIPRLESDEAAIEWCVHKALTGSKMHLLALYLNNRSCYSRKSGVPVYPWIPKSLR